jgi:hypothetical protein
MAFASGGSISVEVVGVAAKGGGRGLGDGPAQRVTQTFDAALSGLHDIADSLQAALRASLTPPDAVTVQLGINFSASGGLVIASGTAGASLNITMEWKKA